jgi:hypothetical protein
MHATLDEAAVAVFGLTQLAPGLTGLGLGQGQGLTTNRCVTVSPSGPCQCPIPVGPVSARINLHERKDYISFRV